MIFKIPKHEYIDVGPHGGVHVDVEKFFAQPEVQQQLKELQEMNITGKKRNKKTTSRKKNTNSSK